MSSAHDPLLPLSPAALMLSLLPEQTLHILDEDSAKAAWLEPWRELARTIAFNAEHAVSMAKDDPVILVRVETSPEDIAGMHSAFGIIIIFIFQVGSVLISGILIRSIAFI